ncbi:MAG: hypothetical protein KIG95_04430 [Comamonas sp.]|nr:hypothetical protein [Comamonas sp.]
MHISSLEHHYNPIQWNQPQGANLYSTGASGPAPVRPVHPTNAVESVDKIGEGVIVTIRSPERPTDRSANDLDWTSKDDRPEKALKVQKEEQSNQPLTKRLVEFIQNMWRVNALAEDALHESNRIDQHQRSLVQVRNDEPLVYEDPRVKRTGGASSFSR